jgi:hypothetical protein
MDDYRAFYHPTMRSFLTNYKNSKDEMTRKRYAVMPQ